MRTTLSLDDDVLAAARALAQAQGRSLGEVVSELARKGLRPAAPAPRYRNGIPLLPARPGADRATLELVNRLRDEAP
ncbi:CopG family transcriptional regulator [Luteimonas sp. FCS-9]|uniref:CopG family transcriptional regulator n=1 Tax=Luteimonas sp. FCS-9 TaxID=1547516 RepID=UPI00063EC1D0|nr:CopG family transcriptional regulator [Luteimonas sp. FCS-9]KLJ00336.1 CopG family transcriptional regulator [Luteimonas sp. FCS-9]